MGALENSGDSRIFVNTFKGNFTIRANAETEGAVKRINKNNKEVYELHYDKLADVIIQEFEKRNQTEYGFSWNVKLIHATTGETYTLTLPFSGRLTMGLFLRLPNFDINKPVNLNLYHFEAEDKSALVVYQGGNKVEAYWTKDTPNGLPQLEKVMRNGKEEWDSTKRMAFLEKYLNEEVKPKINTVMGDMGSHASELEGDPSQDLPQHDGDKVYEAANQEVPESLQGANGVIWDAEHSTLKRKHEDGNFYKCDEKGMSILDNGAKILVGLPF